MKEEQPTPTVLADEIEASLWRHVVDPWFPACIDPNGGFHQNFDRSWHHGEETERFLVFQSRMIWLAATVSELGGPRAEEFAGYTRHGVRFLADHMCDEKTGAFYGLVDVNGKPVDQYMKRRETYGLAFALFGLAAAARVLNDAEALQLAKSVFGYLDNHQRDDVYGGYFECTDENGVPVLEGAEHPWSDFPYKRKSQNSHLHLLEAFTELYRVWPDRLVRKRLEDMVSMFTNEFYAEPGWLHMYLDLESKPLPGSVTFGHDVEVGHLLQAALEALAGQASLADLESSAGLDEVISKVKQNPAVTWHLREAADIASMKPFEFSRALMRAKGTGFHEFVDQCRSGVQLRSSSSIPQKILSFVDHSLEHGWDDKGGGFYAMRGEDGIVDTTKIWWVQAEGLLALAVMHQITGSPRYWDALLKQWDWLNKWQIDHDVHGLHDAVTTDGEPIGRLAKGHRWKAGYHDGRAFLFVPKILRSLTQPA